MNKTNDKVTDKAELAAAAEEMGSEVSAAVGALLGEEESGIYTVKLRRPVTFEGTEIKEMHFDFESLIGKDSREVQREMALKGQTVLIQSVDEDFKRAMAARACTDRLPDGRKIGADIFDYMTVADVNKVLTRLRRFL